MSTSRRHHGRVIDTSIRIKTTPERAWQAWADPRQIANWFVDRAEGTAAPGEVMTWIFDAFNYRQPVPIVEAEPGRSFVVGGGDAPGPQGLPYLMEITISKDGGETVIRLVNSGFSEDARFDDEYGGVVSGWKMALATLKHWLEHYPLLQRTHRIVMQPVTSTRADLARAFRTVEGRGQWLGGLCPADATVLADTGAEVLLACDAREAVLGLKAFRMGPQQMIALDFSTWSAQPVDLELVVAELTNALQRLQAVTALETEHGTPAHQ